MTDEFVNDVIDAASFEKMQAGVGKTQQTKVLYKSVAKDTTKPMFFRKGKIVEYILTVSVLMYSNTITYTSSHM